MLIYELTQAVARSAADSGTAAAMLDARAARSCRAQRSVAASVVTKAWREVDRAQLGSHAITA